MHRQTFVLPFYQQPVSLTKWSVTLVMPSVSVAMWSVARKNPIIYRNSAIILCVRPLSHQAGTEWVILLSWHLPRPCSALAVPSSSVVQPSIISVIHFSKCRKYKCWIQLLITSGEDVQETLKQILLLSLQQNFKKNSTLFWMLLFTYKLIIGTNKNLCKISVSKSFLKSSTFWCLSECLAWLPVFLGNRHDMTYRASSFNNDLVSTQSDFDVESYIWKTYC